MSKFTEVLAKATVQSAKEEKAAQPLEPGETPKEKTRESYLASVAHKRMHSSVMDTAPTGTYVKIVNLDKGCEEGIWLYRDRFNYYPFADSVQQNTKYVFVNPETAGCWIITDNQISQYSIQPGHWDKETNRFDVLSGWEFEDEM